MEIEDVKKNNKELRKIMISIRTFPSYSEWMTKNNVSPSKVFNDAVKELMDKYKDKKTNKIQK